MLCRQPAFYGKLPQDCIQGQKFHCYQEGSQDQQRNVLDTKSREILIFEILT